MLITVLLASILGESVAFAADSEEDEAAVTEISEGEDVQEDPSTEEVTAYAMEEGSVALQDQYALYFVTESEAGTTYTETCTVTYTGQELTPDLMMINPNDPDDMPDLEAEDSPYTVQYEDNIDVGTATVRVFETRDPENELAATFTITPQSIAHASISLSKSSYTYDGLEHEPAVTVKIGEKQLTENTDYTLSYDDNAKAGTAKVTVTGMGNYEGTASVTFSINLGAGKISSLTPFYNGITVKWSKVDGAEKYVLYRSTQKSSGFKSIKTIQGNSTLSYKDSGLTTGKTYYYKVKAMSGTASATTSVKSATVKPAKTTAKKVSSSNYATLKITWKKVAGANGYVIYRSAKKNGAYQKVATVKKGSTVSYKDKNRTTGKTYYYKVAAYRTASGKKVTGAKSDVISGKSVPNKVSLKKLKTSSGKVTVSWKKVAGASGYVIYRSTSKSGTYKKVKTVSKSKGSWKNTVPTTGKTYYYKVRAYRTVKGKKVYGSYSAVKSIKVPLNRWDKLLNKYQDNSKVNQLIFVKYQGGSKASVVLYDKSGTSWKKVLTCTGYVGKKGIGKTKEGDKKTPTGTYNITGAFGIKSKPTTSLTYTKVNKNLYWCADKSHYNQLIDIRDVPHNCTGEHLIDYPGYYNYGLFLDYNSSNTYGKGSAIFMHCTGSNKYTAGCIAVSQSNMKKILSTLQDGAKICIYKE